MRRRLSIGLLIFVAVASLCGLAGYAFLHRFVTPANWPDPPLYPNAQQVTAQDFGTQGKMQWVSGDPVFIRKVIQFSTADTPQQVKTFYEGRYSGDGWEPTTWGRTVQAQDRLNYAWTSLERSPSVYFVDVITNALPADGTQVEIGVSMFPGY